ncbi:hypothetical protein EJK55_0782 [Moraxella catarrhalis]|uniref:Uncharacterized protein n=1 Tax=Moraxella catarrhalis TaxID=480 RepID=A0ABY0BJJ1_MORCA|nr:hypothetical protein MCR_0137 [Moraxella catarrhalis BBH18]AZQ91345.1 hypothetical protein EJK51_0146 [Moraxella catarrhalis]RUO15744.1 hypothetical protein EJK55_0782 [Moraxella catarrhalis]RUO16084.1 hypothetical protein EJK54_0908 [Moraxella catarrhalis]
MLLIDVAFFATDAKWLLLTHWLIDCNQLVRFVQFCWSFV